MGWLTERRGRILCAFREAQQHSIVSMGPLLSMGFTQGINNMAEESRTNGNIDDLAGTFHGVALLDETVVTEDGDTDIVRFQVETHAVNARREFHHLHSC